LFTTKAKNILIAPLDWGLGHTARCMPLIGHIRGLGHIPIVACNDSQRSFIEAAFGDIEIIYLEGYNITYPAWNKWAQAGLLMQLPAISKAIKSEHRRLEEISASRHIDGIISDNRYGSFLPGKPSVIMTHQLQVQTGLGTVADHLVQKVHYEYLNKFDETWIVDAEGNPNLGGKLSHTAMLPGRSQYIGLLSRFPSGTKMDSSSTAKDKPSLVIMLSGPEPQRSILSGILWEQSVHYKADIVFIEGSEKAAPPTYIPPHITWHNRLAGPQLAPILQNAEIVVSRSGYSTLMDLAALGKKAIVIPTPGQTEQLYLGKHLHRQGAFFCAAQKGFNLTLALKKASAFPYVFPELQQRYDDYKKTLEQWILTL
jgi:UDP:flavonoid glycosyltransferase YjiC (YdhE family)